jgi:hypothetical protein
VVVWAVDATQVTSTATFHDVAVETIGAEMEDPSLQILD